jgi:replicative DNA helicase
VWRSLFSAAHTSEHVAHTGVNGTVSAPPERPRLVRLGDLLGDMEADAAAAHEAWTTGKPRGPVTGLKPLDRELGGVLQPGLHVLHSNSGTGKTAFAWQVACTALHPSVYVSLEMGPLELLKRLTARATQTYLGRLKSGELPPEQVLGLTKRAIASAPNVYLMDATRAYPEPDYLLQVASKAKGDSPHFLLVLDSLHAWVGMAQAEVSEYEAVSAALTTLAQMAHQLACPVGPRRPEHCRG